MLMQEDSLYKSQNRTIEEIKDEWHSKRQSTSLLLVSILMQEDSFRKS